MPQLGTENGYRQRALTPHGLANTLLTAMSDYRKGVGERLEALRRARNLSQENAAHMAGVSTGSWKNWERGRRSPTETNWGRIRKGFELSDDEMAVLRGNPPAPLGLDADPDKLDRIEAELAGIRADLNRILNYLSGERVVDAFRRLPPLPPPQPHGTAEADPPPRRARRARSARG